MTTDMQSVINLMAEAGIIDPMTVQGGESIHFTTPLREDDLAAVIAHLAPDHFAPQYDYRSVHLMKHWQGGWYCTSNIRGRYRGHRCRNVSGDWNAGNIFTHHINPLECARLWIEAYHNLKYNRGGAK